MRTPELAAEVTLQPIRRFPLDAAILFADIMTPLDALGLGLDFVPGPVLERPVRSRADVESLAWRPAAESVPHVLETVRALARELPEQTPLIGFAGAPFTLFCYLVEGRGSKSFTLAKSFLHAEPEASALLLDRLAAMTVDYGRSQVEAGARAIMLFDSWAGLLGPDDYRRFALPAVRAILDGWAGLGVPRIYFPNQGATLLEPVASLPVEVVGIDWRLPLSRARAILGRRITLQGNLDPAALFAPEPALRAAIDRVLEEAAGLPHVFNLGHGIESTTDPERLALLVDHVHRRTARPGARAIQRTIPA
jgi:uroporphyrinogen decarboxylase